MDCSTLERSLWVGMVLWNSEWKEVGPRALGASDFPKLFYHDTHTRAHTRMCTHDCVCVITFF